MKVGMVHRPELMGLSPALVDELDRLYAALRVYAPAAGDPAFTGTEGSVPFVGSAGSLTEDNATFFWDDAINQLRLGTNADVGTTGDNNLLIYTETAAFRSAFEIMAETSPADEDLGTSELRFSVRNPDAPTPSLSLFLMGGEGKYHDDGSLGTYDLYWWDNYNLRIMALMVGGADPRMGLCKAGLSLDPQASLHSQPYSADEIPFIAQGFTAQTADLTQWRDVDANVLSLIDAIGSWHPPHMANSAAQNDAVFYSTTDTACSYKDAGGVVHDFF